MSIRARVIACKPAAVSTRPGDWIGGIWVNRADALASSKRIVPFGRLRARRDLAVSTGSGSITLGLLSDIRNASINTGSGSITLSVPKDLGAELTIDTGSGGIDTEIPLQITMKKRQSLRGRIGDGNGRIVIDTGSGGVRLRSN